MTGRELISIIRKNCLFDKEIISEFTGDIVFDIETMKCKSHVDPDDDIEVDVIFRIKPSGEHYLEYL